MITLPPTQQTAHIRLRRMPKMEDLVARFGHGHRMRYIGGCRCDACREANNGYERTRAALRKAGLGNPLVASDRARAHIIALSEAGIGKKTLSEACDVSESILSLVKTGRRPNIRRETERRILAVTADAPADGLDIPAAPTWRLVDEMVAAGFTKLRIARELGQTGRGLQLGKRRITVRNAVRVERVHARLMASGEVLVPAGDTRRLLQELRDEYLTAARVAREIGFDEAAIQFRGSRCRRSLAEAVEVAHRRMQE